MRTIIYGVAILSVFLISGCTSSGAFLASNRTEVNLQEGNYEIRAANLSGVSEAGYVIGVSFSTGPTVSTLAFGRVTGTGMLYKEAIENLWANYEDEFGSLEGKQLALANIRYDTDILNLLLFTKVTVGVRADVIEFTD